MIRADAVVKPMTVTEVTRLVKERLDTAPTLRDLRVEGEISNLKCPPSGHLYFTLKDAGATLRCVMFRTGASRLCFTPTDGLKTLVRGSLSVFERDGQYQLYISEMEPAGLGSLYLAFEQLKKKLSAEGLFDTAKKRPLPLLPRCVALVTSPTGAAVQDMIRITQRRFPNIHLVVVPVLVQGPAAPADIVRGLGLVPHTGADVVIVGRGGGSLEELWAFNDEAVARAICACPIPVVSAVGHETDTTIADFVADLRAPTPSGAAELVVPERAALEGWVATAAARITTILRHRLQRERTRLTSLRTRRVLCDPLAALAAPRQRVDTVVLRLSTIGQTLVAKQRAKWTVATGRLTTLAGTLATTRRDKLQAVAGRLATAASAMTKNRRVTLDGAIQRLPVAGRTITTSRDITLRSVAERLSASVHTLTTDRRAIWRVAAGRLNALSPLAVLARGFSVCCTPDGTVVRRAAQAPADSTVEIILADGSLDCRVVAHGRGIEEATS